ncbi:hypothetical protein [Nitrospirillum sp. BR 11828]|uniref:hypothetical protein n=1 Tax=Nitrospirillum sp. BR 11828 TaxID=3104325 RepID=UPI002ACADF86|nr:hypothetical protein [Nitrospirillum sp. BR 11828]MDZ5648234.1 hypothetical protein [Nitrospirillum sp. BR 11828]
MTIDKAVATKGNYISNKTAAEAGALIVPLYLMDCSGTRKVGIEVTLTVPTDPSHSVTRLYEFDTGGKGFWASGDGLGAATENSLGSIVTQYTSGITYLGQAVPLTVTLNAAPGLGGPSAKSADVVVGLVSDLYELKPVLLTELNQEEEQKFETESQFPIYDYFYGDFGVSLAATAIVPAKQQPVVLNHPLPSSVPSLNGYNEYSILGALSQFQPNTSNPFFIVDLANTDADTVWGGNPPTPAGDAANSVTGVGRLIIGGSATLMEGFQHIFPILPNPGGTFYSPTGTSAAQTNFVVATEQQIAGTVSVQNESNPPALDTTFTMDTGCPEVTLHAGSKLTQPAYTPGTVTLTAKDTSGKTVTLYSNGQGKWDSTVSSGAPAGYVNSALDPFLKRPTAFWLCANEKERPLTVPGIVGM